MNNLHLLKPDVRTGFLENGSGQEITYLVTDDGIGLKELEEDVVASATCFAGCADAVRSSGFDKDVFTVISCDNEEKGLMAVSYLASIHNKRDGIGDSDDSMNGLSDRDERDFEYYAADEDLEFEDFSTFADDDAWEDAPEYIESPRRIPVVEWREMASHNDDVNPFAHGVFIMGGLPTPKGREPYWLNTRKESICIIYRTNEFMMYQQPDRMLKALKRYKSNKHVYLVAVKGDRNVPGGMANPREAEEIISEVVLEYCAATISVKCESDAMSKYHATVFENWVDHFGFGLSRDFPVEKITDKIVSMRSPGKSEIMEKVVRYVLKTQPDKKKLTEEDFAVLDKFEAMANNGNKKKSEEAFKNDLVGMEAVKDKIKGIMDVMTYNKLRRSRGLGDADFHNVHLMIGAPGTAKSTMAKLLGDMMAEKGLLLGNRFISINGAELKGMYVGHSAPKVKKLFEDYDIIFIDEAYALAAAGVGGMDAFGQEAIAQLILELEEHGMDRLVIFAGYGGDKLDDRDNKMKAFLDSNPGIRSRINTTIFFESYSPQEMVEIFHCQARLLDLRVDKKADKKVEEFFAGRSDRRDFGNGREARSLIENCMMVAASRIAKMPAEKINESTLRQIKLSDVESAIASMEFASKMQYGRQKGTLGFNN